MLSNKKKATNQNKKGDWRFSFYQKKQIFDYVEQNIKADMRPENGFNPKMVKDYLNTEKTREEKIEIRVKNNEKINKTEKIQYDNYIKMKNEILKEDLKKIEIIKKNGKGELPITEEGKLRLLIHFLTKFINSKNIDSICNFYLKINKDNFKITPEIYKEFSEQFDYVENVIKSQDLIELQFTKFHDTIPPLNQTGFKKFDPWQIDVINNIDKGISTIVSAPTSAGKTVLAGYAATKGRTMFIAPTDALCWQIASYVGNFLETDIPIITATYNSIPKDKCQCKDKKNKRLNLSCSSCARSPRDKIVENLNTSIAIVGTPDALLDYIPLLNSNFDWIVMDEIHMIGKEEGSSMELISKIFNNVKFLALSATIGNLNEITQWFQKLNLDRPVENIVCDKRFFNLQKNSYNPDNNEITVLNPLALVNNNEFKDGSIINKNLQATPVDTWNLYNKLKQYYDLCDLDHKKYFELREIVHLDKANKYFNDLIKFMVTNYDDDKINRIISSFKKVELGTESPNLVKLGLLLKEKGMLPGILLQKNTLATLRIVRKFAKDIEKMEDTDFPDLFDTRLRDQKKARRIQEKLDSSIKKLEESDKKQAKKREMSKENRDEDKQELNENNLNNVNSYENELQNLDLEGLYQPHEKYNLNSYQYFKEEQIKEIVNELKLWFPSNGGQYHFIIRLLWRGVGIYAKGLPDYYLRLVQKLTSQKKIAFLFSDMSLVFGVSMPFKTSIIYRDAFVVDDLDSMLYHQMAGRAGRRGLDKEGNVLFVGYSRERVEDLSKSAIPNVVGISKINLVVPHANRISKLINNNLDWDKVFKNPLNGSEEDQLELLDQLKGNYRIDVDIENEGWKFAYKENDLNHLIMMWSLRNTDEEEAIIIAYLLPFIKRGFESMNSDSQQDQILLAQFLCNFISVKKTTDNSRCLQKGEIFNSDTFRQIFNDFDNLGIDIKMSTKIDNHIFESIKFNKIIKTSTEKEADELRERILNFAQKIISIQHYFFESKTTNLAKLFGKLLTRIWWIYHTSSPLMKPFCYYDDAGEYQEVDDNAEEDGENLDYESESESNDSE